MRLGGFLIACGVLAIALGVLLAGAALVRVWQDVPRLVLPLPDERALPELCEDRLELRAYVDGQPVPSPLVVVWSAHDGNGRLLQEGATEVTPGVSTRLGRIPAGHRHELHLSTRLQGRSLPRQASLEVRADEASAATLALSALGLFIGGECLLGLGVALGIWRVMTRLARPLQVRLRRLLRWARGPRRTPKPGSRSRKRPGTGAPPPVPAARSAAGPEAPTTAQPEAPERVPGEAEDTSIPGGAPPRAGQDPRPGATPPAARGARRKAGT